VTTMNKIALVGTARMTETPATGTPVDDLVAGIADLTPERRVLLTAGMLSIFRRAGYLPPTVSSLPDPAPAETLPPCSQGAARALGDVFIDGRLELLPEALHLLARAGQRVPFTLLVDCLELRDRVHRDAARPVLGERGVWLAHQRSAWAWARARMAPEPDMADLKRIWDEGRSEDRLAAFVRLRQLDAAAARDVLTSSWKQEPAEFRQSLLSALALRLSRDDEAFLQVALRDRAGAVRAAAASLLARLPDSAFAARALSRAHAFLDITSTQPSGMWDRVTAAVSRDDRQIPVVARPPERFDPEWEADGWSPKPPKGAGERAHWFVQAVALVDPTHWSERAQATPAALARAAWRGEWGAAVLIAWSRAALLHDAKDWIVALWDSWLAADVGADPYVEGLRHELMLQLFAQMPPDEAQDRAIVLLRDPALAAGFDLESMLERFDRPWPDALGAAVLDAIEAAVASGSAPAMAQVSGLIRAAGPAVSATSFDRALALAAHDAVRAGTTRVAHDVDVFAHQIRLRQRFHQEIESPREA
jgi:hypothetical protein